MNYTVSDRIKDLKKKFRVLLELGIISIVLLAVLSVLSSKGAVTFFLTAVPLLLLAACIFVALVLFLRNQGLIKTIRYYDGRKGDDLLSRIDLTAPLYSSSSALKTSFSLYDSGEAFFIDNPGIAARYADIQWLSAVRNNYNRNTAVMAANAAVVCPDGKLLSLSIFCPTVSQS